MFRDVCPFRGLALAALLAWVGGTTTSDSAAAEKQEHSSPSVRPLRIALVQAAPNTEPRNNLERANEYCHEAKRRGADLVLFPEMFNVGYETSIDFKDPFAVKRWKNKAERSDGSFVQHFRKLAQKLELAIAITYLEDFQGSLRNATSLIDRHGQLLFTYAKVHTCRFFPMEGSLRPGEDFFVAELDTDAGAVQVGVMTCYDREFPESARVLMLKGAELILTPNACGLDHLRLKQFQIRAWENSVVTAMANYANGQGNGRSCVYAANGEELLLADDREDVYLAEVDLEKLHQTRAKTFWGNAWRRPDRYEQILSTAIEEPFQRTDAFDRPNHRPINGTTNR